MNLEPILIGGQWAASEAAGSFQAVNPATKQALDEHFPISAWADLDKSLAAATDAFGKIRSLPTEQIAAFLDAFAAQIEAHADAIVARANLETALPVSPRLADVELPRTTNQLRLAAAAAREGSWAMPTIDTKAGIRSCFAALGPVVVFGPNNFPLAFNGIAGGDFAAAIAAGNPVIAKAHPSHPGTCKLLAEAAVAAVQETELPGGTVQMIYKMNRDVGCRMAADPRVAAIGYTGSRAGGLALKEVCDREGKPAYLELSSVNPVVILPGALGERGALLAEEYAGSCLLGAGQFCTNPGLVLLLAGAATDQFVDAVKRRFAEAAVGVLLNEATQENLAQSVSQLRQAGAEVVVGGESNAGAGCRYANTLLRTTGQQFLANPAALQREAFGNAALFVVCDDLDQLTRALQTLEGNLTGCIYSDTQGSDDDAYDQIGPHLRQKVGRLLNDKMPTGVAVSPAMNHGGPFPATGHPSFTAVGIPASLRRFAMLQCFDNVRSARLPACLRDKNPHGTTWRLIDGEWTQDDAG